MQRIYRWNVLCLERVYTCLRVDYYTWLSMYHNQMLWSKFISSSYHSNNNMVLRLLVVPVILLTFHAWLVNQGFCHSSTTWYWFLEATQNGDLFFCSVLDIFGFGFFQETGRPFAFIGCRTCCTTIWNCLPNTFEKYDYVLYAKCTNIYRLKTINNNRPNSHKHSN